MNTDELRAALEWAARASQSAQRHEASLARALLHMHKENASLRKEIDALTGQHERDERENAELRRVLVMWLEVDEKYGEGREEAADATNRLLAGAVQPAKCRYCDGKGDYWDSNADLYVPCRDCNGTGEVQDAAE